MNDLDKELKNLYNAYYGQDVDTIVKKYNDLIKKNDNKKITKQEDVCYFYRKLFESVTWFRNSCLVDKMSSMLLRKFNRKVPKNSQSNPYFNPIIDVLILTGLFYQNEYPLDAIQYFEKACKHGEKYLEDSKKNYHDSLCCALTWAGALYYNADIYEKSKMYFQRALELYESVKNLKGFYYEEYDPNVIRNYLVSMKE